MKCLNCLLFLVPIAPISDVIQDANWILSAQLPSGAIATYPDKMHINPYFANFAAQGLAHAYTDTGDTRYSDAAWRWLQWYTAHQDADGYVTDYNVDSTGAEISTGTMDSTDSYAGTFLITANIIYQATKDKTKLATIHTGIGHAVFAIESTLDDDGLTWAKPDWHVKYLMDQAEVYAGLKAAVKLSHAIEDTSMAIYANTRATRVHNGVATLWNPSTGSYDWAKMEDGARNETDWNHLYPDAAQQPWAVMFGLVPKDRAVVLMNRFSAEQPSWDQPQSGYWAPIGNAYLKVGDKKRAATAYHNIRSTAMNANRAWPYNTAVAGQLITLGSG